MIVRTARPDELIAAGELTAAAYVADGFVPPDSAYLDALRDADTRFQEAQLLVAVDGTHEHLLGTVTFCEGGTAYAETAGPGEAAFRMLAVDPSERGRGVGESLVHACLDRARAVGAATLRLSTLGDMHTAQRLYERVGFRRTPELDWSPDSEVTLLTYALDL